ncbi:N(4)-(Beta-N-acetylglucosaminyl)-L-asparaginase-like isoform X3 [Varanus komodoensis]|uniref:N(4)-(Beta-N-acetylglucosaminyl)-L-asparaginase- like isoform X3 n=1 Tax=Varanus komodoensis TaxID=61221 RepID=UPI001CF79EEA|nr:N(4)-(Beta-N-acetylglucosaminyl)-L-asparaginase-like isoform X3 [Varanus komodoensis]
MAAAAGTWAFAFPAVRRMKQLLLQGGLATDCLQEAMADIENDEETGSFVIGRGGYPNKDGIIQCDAAIMEGQPGRFGAVAALPGVGTPLAVARKVMEEAPHSFLVGDGAVAFAENQGFIVEENNSMMSKHSTEAYQEYLENERMLKKHDTLGLIALDIYGNITVATGDGDMIMCFCPCFHVILLMKEGMSPMDACQTVVQDILQRTGKENMFELGIIAMNMKGEVGAASSMSFPYCIWSQGKDVVEQLVHEA